MTEFKEVNQTLGQHIRVGPFSLPQFIAAGLSAGVAFVLLNGIFDVDIVFTIFFCLWLGATLAVLSGDKPYLFWSKLWPFLPYWTRGYARYTVPLRKRLCLKK